MSVALPALLAGLSVAVALGPAPVPLRLAAVLPARPSSAAHRRPRRGRRLSVPVASCALGGVAVALVVGGRAGLVLGLALALAGPRALARLEPRAVREERERLAADLPLALDLLAACLTGGAPLTEAVRAVSEAVPGPCGHRLARVAAALEVGSPPSDAWRVLAAGSGPQPLPEDELAAAAARVLARSGDGGTPVAAAVCRLASEAREAGRARGQAAAERAGVLAVAPLGLCFLPAFVLLGVVPVIAGLVGPLLSGL